MEALAESHAAKRVNEDTYLALELDAERLLVVVADGAGGASGGIAAARLVALRVCAQAQDTRADQALFWSAVLIEVDRAICEDVEAGFAAAVVAVVTPRRVVGASVGDCAMWWFGPACGVEALTESQRRKPLLGDGGALPVAFEREGRWSCLAAATDGVATYLPARDLRALLTAQAPPGRWVERVRLPSGGFWDDTTVCVMSQRV